MSFNYDRMSATAKRLIAGAGLDVTVSRINEVIFDPVEGDELSGQSSFTAAAVKTNYKRKEVDGTVIKRGDIRLLLEAGQGEPAIDDKLTIDGDKYRVMDVEIIKPKDIVLYYVLQIRL